MTSLPSMQDLLEAGVHFGHQVRRGHPRMREYIFGVRDGVHIINLELSEAKLKEAAGFVNNLGQEGKVLLFVGTKKQAQPIVKELAEKLGVPYVDVKWVGGMLTNFDEVRRNIQKLADLAEKKQQGELSHYTKKEQLLISRKLEKFAQEMGGVAKMDKLPDALFIIDCTAEKTALAEANRLKIPVVAIADTNCNPALVDYPIPGNDDATKSIKIIAEAISAAYGDGLKKCEKSKVKSQEEEDRKKLEADGGVDAVVAEEVAAAEEKVEKEAVKESEKVV